jgi:hypothetical protein
LGPGRVKDWSQSLRDCCQSAQGIEAEIPQKPRSGFEELERKARFFAAKPQKMRKVSSKKVNAVALVFLCALLRYLGGYAILLGLGGAMAEKPVNKKEHIQLSLSKIVSEKLTEASVLYGVPVGRIITEIVEENLPKWIQRSHVKKNFSIAAQRLKNAQPQTSEEVLIKQDELDKVFRLMSSPGAPA